MKARGDAAKSPKKLAEAKSTRFNQARTILARVDHAIIHISDQNKMLEEVCRVMVQAGGFKLAWVGLFASDGTVQPVAKAGASGYLNAIRKWPTPKDLKLGKPPSVTSHGPRPPLVVDMKLDVGMVSRWGSAARFGLRYAAAFPLQIEGRSRGSFQVYLPEGHPFEKHELDILAHVCEDLSLALTAAAHLIASSRADHDLRKLSRAVEQSPVSIIVTNVLGEIEYVNPKFCELTGYQAKEVLGENPRILKSNHLPAAEYRRLWRTITNGGVWRGEFCNRKKNGELFWEGASISPIRADGGAITGFVAVKEDITAHKFTQKALLESEERFRRFTNATFEGICVSENGRILDCNDQFLRMFGCERSEMIGKRIVNLAVPGSRELVSEAISTGQAQRYEIQLVRKDGSVFYAEAQARLARIGPRTLRFKALRDVSEHKWLEREVLRRVDLEQERIGRDLHDGLCQILVGAKCRVGVLEKKLADLNLPLVSSDVKILEQILNRTILQARDLAKGLNPVSLKVNGLVPALEELTKEVNRAGNARCAFRSDQISPTVNCDEANHLFRIVQEAVQNAIKHAQAREISISLREKRGKIVLTVVNDGKKFPANQAQVIGAGLHNMRMRATMIGGVLAIRPGRRGGSVVSVSLRGETRPG